MILPEFKAADMAAVIEVVTRFRDQSIGITDASVVVLAERHRCYDVLTLDHRHFQTLRTKSGKRLRVVPQP